MAVSGTDQSVGQLALLVLEDGEFPGGKRTKIESCIQVLEGLQVYLHLTGW